MRTNEFRRPPTGAILPISLTICWVWAGGAVVATPFDVGFDASWPAGGAWHHLGRAVLVPGRGAKIHQGSDPFLFSSIPDADELLAHEERLQAIDAATGAQSVWRRL